MAWNSRRQKNQAYIRGYVEGDGQKDCKWLKKAAEVILQNEFQV